MPGLDARMRRFAGYRIRRASSAVMVAINRAVAPFGLRRTTFAALYLIERNPGMGQSQIAEALGVERPNFVRLIAELEKAGLVRRRRAPDDRRAYLLAATDAGSRICTDALAAVQEVEQALLEGLTPDQLQALDGALLRIETNARAADEGRAALETTEDADVDQI